jgi:hypothetical protein
MRSAVSTRALLIRILLAAGLVLLAGGLILGFLPKTAAGVSCGSAFHGTDAATVADYGSTLTGSLDAPPVGGYAAACADARSAAKTAPIVLLVLGGAALVSGIVLAASKNPTSETTTA